MMTMLNCEHVTPERLMSLELRKSYGPCSLDRNLGRQSRPRMDGW
jgi:hypothetical protein